MKKLLIFALAFSFIGVQAAAKKVTAIKITVTSESEATLSADQADQTQSGKITKGQSLVEIFPIITDSATPITVADLKGQIAEAWGVDVKNITLKENGRVLADTVKFDAAYSGRTPLSLTATIVIPAAPAVTAPATATPAAIPVATK